MIMQSKGFFKHLTPQVTKIKQILKFQLLYTLLLQIEGGDQRVLTMKDFYS